MTLKVKNTSEEIHQAFQKRHHKSKISGKNDDHFVQKSLTEKEDGLRKGSHFNVQMETIGSTGQRLGTFKWQVTQNCNPRGGCYEYEFCFDKLSNFYENVSFN